jgi:ABC-type sugar transport system ATPase subunit
VAARSEIYRAINALVEGGAAVVMVSSDLPELLGMADRILVMRRGRLVAELDGKSTTQEEVLRYAALEDPGRERIGPNENDAEGAEGKR